MFGLFKKEITPATYGEHFAKMQIWQQREERSRWANDDELNEILEGNYPKSWYVNDDYDSWQLKPFNGPSIEELASYKGSWKHEMDLSQINEAKMLESSMGGATRLRGGPRLESPYL